MDVFELAREVEWQTYYQSRLLEAVGGPPSPEGVSLGPRRRSPEVTSPLVPPPARSADELVVG